MTSEDPRLQSALWWITSIAIAVVCCSSLFVLFANYVGDIKSDLREINARLSIVEDRGNTIYASLELLRARLPQNTEAQKAATDVAAEAPQAEPGIAVEGKPAAGPTAGELMQTPPTVVSPTAPTVPVTVPPVPAAEVPAPASPAVNVPVIQPTPEKK